MNRYGCWLCLLLSLPPAAGHAFALFPYDEGGETRYLKWGDNSAGRIGGTVFWSFVPPGTAGDPGYCGEACPGSSGASLWFQIAPGAGFEPRSLESLRSVVEMVFDRWSVVTGIDFIGLPQDSGVAVNAVDALPPDTGYIRIGIFAFASGGGAVGYAPPPNGGTGAGDILFDSGSFFQIAPGEEGDPYDTGFAPNDFPGLLLHELGHALGLAHPAYDGSCPVMQNHPDCFGIVNRVPDPDDTQGMRFLYGSMFADGFE